MSAPDVERLVKALKECHPAKVWKNAQVFFGADVSRKDPWLQWYEDRCRQVDEALSSRPDSIPPQDDVAGRLAQLEKDKLALLESIETAQTAKNEEFAVLKREIRSAAIDEIANELEREKDQFVHDNFAQDPETGVWEGGSRNGDRVAEREELIDRIRERAKSANPSGWIPDKCPICGKPEVEADTPRTVYACGSSDYDRRDGTFQQGSGCNPPKRTNGWILVGERLPEERVRVIAGEAGIIVVGDCFYGHASNKQFGGDDWMDKAWRYSQGEQKVANPERITHFQPLPSIPPPLAQTEGQKP